MKTQKKSKKKRTQAPRRERARPAQAVSIDELLDMKQREELLLLKQIHANLAPLERLLDEADGHWGYDDPIYRFYHQSFKVYYVQDTTTRIVTQLHALAPHLPLNARFMEIFQQGTGKTFTLADNKNWNSITRPIVEAFLHARFFLQMACKYGRELQEAPKSLPSGWAALLYLFNLR